ncbi:hypothetical protein PQG02_24790 [Nostoc sp. UHCC 0926]|uniref:hypothetical protein n=1 Tax=Nostoc sp. TaxID=1180 RepID=UPI0027A73154|nr:hypothetical protein PQG02_24790 [Nostoc sp. UHCC 0926]
MTNQTFTNGYALLIGVGADLPITVKYATAIRDILIDGDRIPHPPHDKSNFYQRLCITYWRRC